MTAYKVRINGYNHLFDETVGIYRAAVDFFIGVALRRWENFESIHFSNEAIFVMEQLTNPTSKRPKVEFPFAEADKRFYKMPAYLRRAAIMDAVGKVKSHKSNYANWETQSEDVRGEKPSEPKAGFVWPSLYHKGTYIREDAYVAKIKVFVRNTWDWVTVQIRKSDVDYIRHHCTDRKECAPTLRKRGKRYYLDFPFEEVVTIPEEDPFNEVICAVDLGINNPCVCCIMTSDGTVLGRRFLKLPREYDCLKHSINRIKKSQQHGGDKNNALWAIAKGINNDIAVKTAQFIVEVAAENKCTSIVMEHLDVRGKKRGFKKQRLHHWRVACVQDMIRNKAHRLGMHVFTVCAWGTSKLAFDGSGTVQRCQYIKDGREVNNYSMCLFANGKEYNCDLNAAYNIGARYFVRGILKSLPATVRLDMEAKVPPCAKRSTCTYSMLLSLNAAIESYAA